MGKDFIASVLPHARDLLPDIREGIYEFLRRELGLQKPEPIRIHGFMDPFTGEFRIPSAEEFLSRYSMSKLYSEIERLHKTIEAHQTVLEIEKDNLESLEKIKAEVQQVFGVYEEAKNEYLELLVSYELKDREE